MNSSMSQLFLQANPPEEHFSGYSQEFASAEAQRFIEWFEKEGYERPTNCDILQQWLDVNNFPVTYRNLRIAFIWARTEGLLTYDAPEADEPEVRVKYSRPTVLRVQKTEAEKEEEAELVSVLRELDRITPRSKKKIDVGSGLREEYQKSLRANRNGGKTRHMSLGEARAQVSKQFPELKLDTPAYSEWVARLQFNQND
jgi:hypothetical protein